MEKYYNVYYFDSNSNEKTYEITTNNFKKWLKEHNAERVSDGNEPEKDYEFKIIPVEMRTY